MIPIQNWKLKKQRQSFEMHKNNISEIYDMYHEKILYKYPQRQNGKIIHVDKSNYRYSLKDIGKKFNIIDQIEIHFLVIQDKRGHIGKCKFCEKGVYYSLRTVTEKSSCGHTGYCERENCKELLMKNARYCEQHTEEEWQEFERKSIQIKKETKLKEDKLYLQDFMPGSFLSWPSNPNYILGLKIINNIPQVHLLSKIYLLDICNIWDAENECCYFNAQKDTYLTWCKKEQLHEAMNDLIKWRHQNDSNE